MVPWHNRQVTSSDEATRVAALIDAETRAEALFDEVVARGLIAPGITERELSDAIKVLAAESFGITRYWHKRVVRAGANTLHPSVELDGGFVRDGRCLSNRKGRGQHQKCDEEHAPSVHRTRSPIARSGREMRRDLDLTLLEQRCD